MNDQRRINQILGEVTVGDLIDAFEEAVTSGKGYADARNALREAFAASRPSPFAAQSPVGSGEVATALKKKGTDDFEASMKWVYDELRLGRRPVLTDDQAREYMAELRGHLDIIRSALHQSSVSPIQETE